MATFQMHLQGHKEIADFLIGRRNFKLYPALSDAKEAIAIKSKSEDDEMIKQNWKLALEEAVRKGKSQ